MAQYAKTAGDAKGRRHARACSPVRSASQIEFVDYRAFLYRLGRWVGLPFRLHGGAFGIAYQYRIGHFGSLERVLCRYDIALPVNLDAHNYPALVAPGVFGLGFGKRFTPCQTVVAVAAYPARAVFVGREAAFGRTFLAGVLPVAFGCVIARIEYIGQRPRRSVGWFLLLLGFGCGDGGLDWFFRGFFLRFFSFFLFRLFDFFHLDGARLVLGGKGFFRDFLVFLFGRPHRRGLAWRLLVVCRRTGAVGIGTVGHYDSAKRRRVQVLYSEDENGCEHQRVHYRSDYDAASSVRLAKVSFHR